LFINESDSVHVLEDNEFNVNKQVPSKSYTILVVDDTSFMRKMATDCLQLYGHKVVGEAINGKDGIEKYNKLHPDIVLMDLNMPEMNGIDATKEILRIHPQAIILVCSTGNQQTHFDEALAVGAKGYLTKPFNADRLIEVIREYAEPHLRMPEQLKSEAETMEAIEENETIEEFKTIEAIQDTDTIADIATIEAKHVEVSSLKEVTRSNRTNFVTSYMCNWNEEINGESTNFSVICSEKEDKILIEVNDSNHQKQTIQFTFDGFNQLHNWLENHLGKTTA